ncbi:MAG: exonuclease SbcCD subunit D C-terminal domain-containing protein [Methyloprofundus sp.]|nr:exonuclease SbcCD subunit D C-terminal domain-containing protein [Methyloprofundus sp.]
MLRIIHTADWHLGHHLHGVSRHYEHQKFFEFLLQQLKNTQADVLIVAGDIFDTANPPAAAQSQLYDFLVSARTDNPQLNMILIGGNHDSAARLDAPASLLKSLGISVIGGLSNNEEGQIDWQRLLIPLYNKEKKRVAWCGAMPFLRHSDLPPVTGTGDNLISGVKSRYAELTQALKNQAKPDEALLLTGHCYMVGGNLSELSERKILGGNQHALPVDLFSNDIAYTALGHLHCAQTVDKHENIRYSGSPIPLSFDEKHYAHQLVQIDLHSDKSIEIEAILIPRSIAILRLPNSSSFCDLDSAITQLKALDLDSDLPLEQQPFLELRIALEKPEPSLRQKIEETIADLPLRLLKISTVYAGKEQGLADSIKEQRLEDLQPEQVFLRCYENKYASPAPDEFMALFHELQENIQGTD